MRQRGFGGVTRKRCHATVGEGSEMALIAIHPITSPRCRMRLGSFVLVAYCTVHRQHAPSLICCACIGQCGKIPPFIPGTPVLCIMHSRV